MNTITTKFSSFRDGIFNKFVPRWSCSNNHPERVNKTINCQHENCDQTIWDTNVSYKLWLNLIFTMSVIVMISIPTGLIILLVSLKQDIKNKESIIKQRDITIGNLQGEIKTKDQQIKEKQKIIDTKNGEISTKNTEIEKLKGQITANNTQIQQLRGQITANNTQIQQLQQQVTNKSIEINNLQQQIIAKNKQIKQLQKQINLLR